MEKLVICMFVCYCTFVLEKWSIYNNAGYVVYLTKRPEMSSIMGDNNMKNENDLRVIKSRANICSGFIELLAEKPLADITIQEICDRALCSRNTFYAHFPYKEAVLEYMRNDCIDQIVQSCEADGKEVLISPQAIWNCVFNTLSSASKVKERLCFLLQYDRSSTMALLADKLYEHCLSFTAIRPGSADYPVAYDFYSRYISCGIAGFIVSWLEHPDVSKEEACRMLHKIHSEPFKVAAAEL